MDAKNGQLMLVKLHYKADTSVQPSVKAFKKRQCIPFFCVVTMWLTVFV